jgi:uncharacterized Zn finger protein (UPF0148 family)
MYLQMSAAVCCVICQVRMELKWAEVSAVKAEVEQQVAALLGPKTEEDVAAAAAPKKKVFFCISIMYMLPSLLEHIICGLPLKAATVYEWGEPTLGHPYTSCMGTKYAAV